MIITMRNRKAEEVRRRVMIGDNLRGLRVIAFTIESREELRKFLHEDSRQWIADSLAPAFSTNPEATL